jgi:hypothetical protein
MKRRSYGPLSIDKSGAKKSRSHTKKGPGRMPFAKPTSPFARERRALEESIRRYKASVR